MQEMLETQFWSLSREDSLRRKWHPTPVFLPGESYGQRSLVGHSPQGPKESPITEQHSHTALKLLESAKLRAPESAGTNLGCLQHRWRPYRSPDTPGVLARIKTSRNHSIWGPIKELRAFCLEEGTFRACVRTTFRVTEMDRMKVPHRGREIMVQLTKKELLAELIRKV